MSRHQILGEVVKSSTEEYWKTSGHSSDVPWSAGLNPIQEFHHARNKGANTDATLREFRMSEDDSTARICPQLQFKCISQTFAQRATLRGGMRGQACFEAMKQPAALQFPNIHREKSPFQSAIPVSSIHWDVLPFNFFAVKSH